MLLALLFFAALFLAYANGANDNFKGVATLYGSQTLSYQAALRLATVATLLGSLCAILFAHELVARFSGHGLVPTAVTAQPAFLFAVALAAAATVILATRLGFPISTTHSLVGALAGAGGMAAGPALNLQGLGASFFLPLLVSPLLTIALGAGLYRLFHHLRTTAGLSKESCICIGQELVPLAAAERFDIESQNKGAITLAMGEEGTCSERYVGSFWGIPLQRTLDLGHIFSGGVVCFARALNDTPKIVGLLLAAQILNLDAGMFAVGCAMAIGGLLNARRVAETMSHRITPLSHGQGFSANLATGLLVIFASRMGVPVSTTHVSVGSILGVAISNHSANAGVVKGILLSWVITLPVALTLGALIYLLIS